MPKPGVKAVLVAFASRDGDPYERDRSTGEYVDPDPKNASRWGPALRLLAYPNSGLYGRVSHFYYLCHPAEAVGPKRKKGRSAREVAKDTEAALKSLLPLEQRPFFQTVEWSTKKAPNDHGDLFEFVRAKLREIRATHPDAEIVLQLSSGTSAMHAVLLIAGSVGLISGPVRLIQSERNDGAARRAEQPYTDVSLEVPTILKVAQGTSARHLQEDAAPTLAYDQAQSPALQKAVSAALKAARVRFPVLLRGERGVGKSSFARLIRAASPFRRPSRDSTWPSIACGQFVEPTLLYVELCGAVKGAYTGLHRNRDGLLKAANGDTLFLDEVHDLDHRCQRAIIRVIEDGAYTRLGEEDRVLHSRFRLITGTNQSTDDLAKSLSADFLDRIRDLEVTIPPLRDCRDDLPWMWKATCEQIGRDHVFDTSVLIEHTGLVARALGKHPLPGNWRDLRRVAARLTVDLMENGKLGAADTENILNTFLAEDGGPASQAHIALEPILSGRRDVTRLRELEQKLGENLERFWEIVPGLPPQVALEELLGDRHRAARASEFIQRAYPTQWTSRAPEAKS